jgi:hypothetical protein
MLSVVKLSVIIMLVILKWHYARLSVIFLSTGIQSAVGLNVIMLNVMAPLGLLASSLYK